MDLVLLHALPFDGSMWHAHLNMLPGHTHALSLYACGDNLTDWAHKALEGVSSDKLIVVGNSVGGSCALEMAALAPERISALVLVGAKAARRIDSKLQDECIELIQNCGLEAAWDKYWAPFFAPDTVEHVLASAKEMALQLSPEHVAHGVRPFTPVHRDLSFLQNWTAPSFASRANMISRQALKPCKRKQMQQRTDN